jgi:methylated-DNA-[protein]-cysteine S-methyltransferase
MLFYSHLDALEGISLQIVASPAGVREIRFGEGARTDGPGDDGHPLIAEAKRQLRAYFAGELCWFELPLDVIGTDFQKRVWRALRSIPYGTTRSYSSIAGEIGAPRAVRAVGAANGRNPIPIVVPCHRVIGANGDLVGFGGGLRVKKLLLDLETRYAERFRKAAAR